MLSFFLKQNAKKNQIIFVILCFYIPILGYAQQIENNTQTLPLLPIDSPISISESEPLSPSLSSNSLSSRLDGPLTYGPQYPLMFMQTRFDPESAFVLPDGQWLFDIGINQSNSFEYNRNNDKHFNLKDGDPSIFYPQEGRKYSIYIDLEATERIGKIAYGLWDRFEFQFIYREIRFGPGFLDPLIESFHDTFSLSNEKRRTSELSKVEIYIWDDEAQEYIFKLTDPPQGYREESNTLSLKMLLLSTDKEAFSVKISSNFNDRYIEREWNEATSDSNTEVNNFNDYNISFYYSSIFESISLHVAYSNTVREKPVFEKSPKSIYYYFVGISWHILENFDLIFQNLVHTSMFPKDDITYNGSDIYETTLGIRWKITDKFLIDTGFAENVTQGPANIDVSFFMNFTMLP